MEAMRMEKERMHAQMVASSEEVARQKRVRGEADAANN